MIPNLSSGPYVAILVIAIVAKVKSGREVSDEETPLLAGEAEALLRLLHYQMRGNTAQGVSLIDSIKSTLS
jgi:hypothetical protein